MPRLSVVIITRNEEKRITRCLQSVHWAYEIIVLDSGSTDRTVEICKRWTPHVYETDWPSYGVQKNRGIARATGDWILSIDADEEVSADLRREIEFRMARDEHDGYEIPRLTSYCGQYMRHGGWWPDHVPRLARQGKAVFSEASVHEKMIIAGSVGRLEHPLLHDSSPDLESVLHKMNLYSTLGAEALRAHGHSSGLLKTLARGAWTFFRAYVLKAGFLDGSRGFIAAVSHAEGSYYKYLKLWLSNDDRRGNSPS